MERLVYANPRLQLSIPSHAHGTTDFNTDNSAHSYFPTQQHHPYAVSLATMGSQQPQKAQPQAQKPALPNPYAQAILPNPYAAATVASSAPVQFTEEQAKAEQQKKAPGIICSTSLIASL